MSEYFPEFLRYIHLAILAAQDSPFSLTAHCHISAIVLRSSKRLFQCNHHGSGKPHDRLSVVLPPILYLLINGLVHNVILRTAEERRF